MHPRNRYNTKPDFGELADFRPSLKPYLIQKSKSKSTHTSDDPAPAVEKTLPGKSPTEKRFPYTLDFSDPEALRELSCAVLAKDFSLNVNLPLDKLIPAVPQRLNYIHWVEDLLGLCGDVKTSCDDAETSGGGVKMTCEGVETSSISHVIGIDIGKWPISIMQQMKSYMHLFVNANNVRCLFMLTHWFYKGVVSVSPLCWFLEHPANGGSSYVSL